MISFSKLNKMFSCMWHCCLAKYQLQNKYMHYCQDIQYSSKVSKQYLKSIFIEVAAIFFHNIVLLDGDIVFGCFEWKISKFWVLCQCFSSKQTFCTSWQKSKTKLQELKKEVCKLKELYNELKSSKETNYTTLKQT